MFFSTVYQNLTNWIYCSEIPPLAESNGSRYDPLLRPVSTQTEKNGENPWTSLQSIIHNNWKMLSSIFLISLWINQVTQVLVHLFHSLKLQSYHFGDQRTWRKTWGKNRLRCQPYRDLFCTSLVLRSCLPWVQVTMNHMALFIKLIIRGDPLYQYCNSLNIVQKWGGGQRRFHQCWKKTARLVKWGIPYWKR